MGKAVLVDTTKCIGCRACQVACKAWNGLPAERTKFPAADEGYENPHALSGETFTRITFHELHDGAGGLERSVFVKRQCMHCEAPACVSACPVGALQKVQGERAGAGAVTYDWGKCIGCRYCMVACPFNVPKFEWDERVPKIQKCTFCFDRLERGAQPETQVNGRPVSGKSAQRLARSERLPACVKACPTGALIFGERDAVIAEGHRRIAEKKQEEGGWRYVDHLYGETEVGGTNWMYLANVPFERLGLRTDLGERPYPEYTHLALTGVPPAVIGVGAVLAGVYWISNRRSGDGEDPRSEP